MAIFIIGIDTNISFSKEVYYILFKGYEIKYVPKGAEGLQDDLLLKMNDLDEEKAFFLITEFLSALSFGFDEIFECYFGLTNEIEKFSWKNMKCSVGGERRISATKKVDDFSCISLLKNEKQIHLARLYRVAQSANNIYTQILFFWHCLCCFQPESGVVDWINRIKDNPLLDVKPQAILDVLENQCLSKEKEDKDVLENQCLSKEKEDKLGNYIRECIRNSIAHIERDEKKKGKSLTIDSLKENQHLYEVKDILKKMARYRLINEYKIINSPDLKYFNYFTPKS